MVQVKAAGGLEEGFYLMAKSRFPGTCFECGKPHEKGEPIAYNGKGEKGKKTKCIPCATVKTEEAQVVEQKGEPDAR